MLCILSHIVLMLLVGSTPRYFPILLKQQWLQVYETSTLCAYNVSLFNAVCLYSVQYRLLTCFICMYFVYLLACVLVAYDIVTCN